MIKLFTDSAANLPTEIIKKHNISVIPLTFNINGKEMTEFDNDYNGKEFYNTLRSGTVSRTSMVNSATFEEAFEKEIKEHNDILYIGLSGGVSGTTSAAELTAKSLLKRYDCKIEVIDSLSASLGEGLLVIEAAEMIENGAVIEDIKKHILTRIPEMSQCFTVEDLKYLRRTGRINAPVALIGEILKIHPLLKGDEHGKIVIFGKLRGFKKALDALAERFSKFAANKSERIGIAHADNDENASYLLCKLKANGFTGECINVCYEPTTGSHVGPGTIALFFFGKGRYE